MHPTAIKKPSTALPNATISRGVQSTSVANRWMMFWSGNLLFGLGFIGMFLPLLPTTVFWIAAAVCYSKSSPRLYHKLISHKQFGQSIRDFIEAGVISNKGKWLATSGMAVSGAILYFSPFANKVAAVGIIGLAIAAIFVATRPSVSPEI